MAKEEISISKVDKRWLKDGKLHREGAPAMECRDGEKRWYKNGELHREDGPAVIGKKNCDLMWYLNGEHHRADGPAILRRDGGREWWYKGFFVGSKPEPEPVLWARLTSEPLLNGCIEDFNKDKYWYKDDVLHREDGPAIEKASPSRKMGWVLQGNVIGWGVEGFWKFWSLLRFFNSKNELRE